MTKYLILAALLACAPLAAEELKVGDDVADFTPNNWVNPPTWGSFEELRGDVILFFAWGINSEAAVKAISGVNSATKKPGVHVVSLYRHLHKFEELEAAVTKHKITWPIALDSFYPAGYAAPDVPKFWVVGADGKVKFIGESGYEKTLNEELAKVKYPGLGKDKVHKTVEPAAKLFVQGKYAQAHAAATKVFDNADDKAVEEDADYVVKRIEGRARTLAQRAEDAEATTDYAIAIRCWEELGKYKGVEDAGEAAARLKKLTDSDEVKKQITARRDLISLQYELAVEWSKTEQEDAGKVKKFREDSRDAYKKFAEKHKGTSAATVAEERIAALEELIKEG
jgi:hypothetical protein